MLTYTNQLTVDTCPRCGDKTEIDQQEVGDFHPDYGRTSVVNVDVCVSCEFYSIIEN